MTRPWSAAHCRTEGSSAPEDDKNYEGPVATPLRPAPRLTEGPLCDSDPAPAILCDQGAHEDSAYEGAHEHSEDGMIRTRCHC
jgi:hypothetical protein